MDIRTMPRLYILFLLAVLSVALLTAPRTGATQPARGNTSVAASTKRGRSLRISRVRSLQVAPIAGAEVFGMAISSDSSLVVYTIAQGASAVAELYSVPLAGGTKVKLNAPLAPGSGGIQWFNMGISMQTKVRLLRAYFFRVICVFTHKNAFHVFLMGKTNYRCTAR
jgi:hypothetical protein